MGAIRAMARLVVAARQRRGEQWQHPDRLAELRRKRLWRLARIAAGSVYYRGVFAGAGICPDDWRSVDALSLLPLLDKATLQQRGGDLVPEGSRGAVVRIVTSGSTGEPLRLFRTAEDQAEVSAVWARLLHAYGRRPFDTQVNIASGRAVAARGPAAVLRRLGVLRVHQMSAFDPPERQVAELLRIRPRVISAYGIALELAAEAVLAAGVESIRPQLVYTSGTALSPPGRAAAERAFGVRPLDVYAANEVGPIAWECPHNRGSLHLNGDTQITEIVDELGRQVPDGEMGEVVVTQLKCLAQPLFRYRLGDVARIQPASCSCGRGLKLLSPVLGRTQHTIRAPDGRVLNTVTASTIFGPMPEVRRYQVQQVAPGELLILVVPAPGSAGSALDAVTRVLRERLGTAFQFHVRLVESIPLAPSGKFQTIVPLAPDAHGRQFTPSDPR